MDIREKNKNLKPLLDIIHGQPNQKIRNVDIHKDADNIFHLYINLKEDEEPPTNDEPEDTE